VTEQAIPRGPGRPRDRTRDEEILTAVLQLLEDTSYANLTMAAIARTAGVGKATLYLRWSSKAAVVADAVVSALSTQPFPDLGDVRSDLVAGLDMMIELLNTSAPGRILPGLVGDLHHDKDLIGAFQQRYFQPRRASIRGALQRGMDRGELAADTDVELVIDALVGPVYYRLLFRSDPIRISPDDLVDLVLRACRVPAVPGA
jgi:AcrR family transcriptional regulator